MSLGDQLRAANQSTQRTEVDSKPLRTSQRAVERSLADLSSDELVLVACSGGADSLALAAAVAKCQDRGLIRAGAVIVDHGLQSGSLAVATRAAEQCAELGLDPVDIVQVDVARGAGSGGLEAAARDARYAALDSGAKRWQASAVLLAHTQDDQAETVLLGLARGSGSRSIKGMSSISGLYRRPFLDLRRTDTEAVCVSLGLQPHYDLHNQDQKFTRVRLRQLALPALKDALGDQVIPALARTASQLQDDCAALDGQTEVEEAQRISRQPDGAWLLAGHVAGMRPLGELPRAIRTRIYRLFLLRGGIDPEKLTSTHIEAIDALVVAGRNRGPVRVPGDRELARVESGLLLYEAGPLSTSGSHAS